MNVYNKDFYKGKKGTKKSSKRRKSKIRTALIIFVYISGVFVCN